MSEDEEILYCAICGAPLLEQKRFATKIPWWEDAVVLKDSPDEGKEVEEHAATVIHDTLLRLSDDGEQVRVHCKNQFMSFTKDFYLATHSSCLAVLKRNLFRRQPYKGLLRSPGQIWTLRHVWQCLHHRFRVRTKDMGAPDGPAYRLTEPHDYYMPKTFAEPEWSFNIPIVEADPLNIPDLTTTILRHLQEFKGNRAKPLSPEQEELKARLAQLPNEMLDHAISFLNPLTETSTKYVLPPPVWRAGLLSGKLIPYLWDLDPVVIREKDAAPDGSEDSRWDWELLARQLAQPNAFDKGQPLTDVPMGLANRRRIWQLLDDMYLGDVQPSMPNVFGRAPFPIEPPRPDEMQEDD